MLIEELSNILRQNGIVGAGGAGFPTYAKLDNRVKTIILNCAECEPLLKLHRQLLEQYAYEILQTFFLVGETLGVNEIIIGIKNTYNKTIEALNEHIGNYKNIKLGLLEEVYPAGDEIVLIYELTGKIIKAGNLPVESGIAVFNVETVYNIYRALKQETPVIDKLVTVVGEVKNPITVRVPIGMSIKDVISLTGGETIENPVYFVGGPMMGYIGSEFQSITKTTNAILVLEQSHIIVTKKRQKSSINLKRAAASCCQCTLCTDICPRNLLGHPIEPHKFMLAAICKDFQDKNIFLNTMFCSSCGICEMYSCMQELSPRSLIADYKEGLRVNGIKQIKDVKHGLLKTEREFRKVPMKRLMNRLDLSKYDKGAPLNNKVVCAKKVKILLSQHIGVPAKALVTVGQEVEKGQIIGDALDGLSVCVHSSINGKVIEVNKKYIIIEKQEECTTND